MSKVLTREKAEAACASIFQENAEGLDEAGATLKLSYQTIAKQHKNRNGSVALRAAETNLKLRGLMREQADVNIGGSVMAAVAAYLSGTNDPKRPD